MKVLWGRVVAAALALFTIVLLVRYWLPITGFLSNIERIGPGNSQENQMLGAIAVGLIGVVIIALVKILTHAGTD